MEKLRFRALAFASLFGAIFFASPASADDYLDEEAFFEEEVASEDSVNDPLEKINRFIFEFNDFLFLKVVRPMANVYRDVTPDPIEEGTSNFFENLRYPVRLAGNVLQGKLEEAGVETGRFVVNSTVGLAGVLRPADEMEFLQPVPKEDIGQVLAVWGVPEGPYVVLPLFGPHTLRGVLGLVGNLAADPIAEPWSWIDDWDWEWQTAMSVGDFFSSRSATIDQYIRMKKGAIDHYTAIRGAYLGYRLAQVAE